MDRVIHVTKTVYTVSDFIDWQRTGGLQLRPYFQRGAVWKPKARSFFIDTLLRGFPVPIIYIQTQTDPKTRKSIRRVVDGQQRLRTIIAYIDPTLLDDYSSSDHFTLMRAHSREYAGRTFDELPAGEQERLLQTELSVHVLLEAVTDPLLLQIFARLNSTGEKLNDQELRNARFHGELKSTVYSLSYDQIDRWIQWGTFTPAALAQMKEVEFLSDIVLMLLEGPGARTKSRLDGLYEENDEEFPESDALRTIVPSIFDRVDELVSTPGLEIYRKPSWLYSTFSLVAQSLYDAPLRGNQDWPTPGTPQPVTIKRLKSLLHDAAARLDDGAIPTDLANALRGASTDRASRAARLTFILSGRS